MSREIKFRAWDGKKMSPPFSLQNISSDDGHACFIDWKNTFEQDYYYLDECEIIQFTGVKDKNNTDIYEGDWCRAEFRTKDGIQVIQGGIKMDEYMWCIDCPKDCGDDMYSINRPHNFEIIGNIYEHKHLLEKYFTDNSIANIDNQ